MGFMKYTGMFSVLVLACSRVAMGDLLPSDPYAYSDGTTTWSGSQAFYNPVDPGSLVISATVDYAVYAPGKFQESFGTATTLTDTSDYVYAYQLFDGNVAGNTTISTFSVGFTGHYDGEGGNKLPANIGYVPDFPGSPAGVQPSTSQFGPPGVAQQAQWLFINTPAPVPPGGYSDVLIYTSPYPPHFDSGTVASGGDSAIEPLPSPVPEPATALLLPVAAVWLLAVRVFRRKWS
jgi:hypothetical protein